MKLGFYARVSTHEQQTLALQRDAMTAYAQQRQGVIVLTVEENGSGVSERRQRDTLMRAARRREIDAIVVWRLDRWGRSLADLVGTLHELQALGVGFISLHEALDFTTPTGRDAGRVCGVRVRDSARTGESRHCASPETWHTAWAAADRGPSCCDCAAAFGRRPEQIGECPTIGHQSSLGAALPGLMTEGVQARPDKRRPSTARYFK
jgi:Resolvase, N terminal domain